MCAYKLQTHTSRGAAENTMQQFIILLHIHGNYKLSLSEYLELN